ncbi:MAG: hypothetical protein WCF57_10125 [Pyrinomonadaceae bacterium]
MIKIDVEVDGRARLDRNIATAAMIRAGMITGRAASKVVIARLPR